MEYILLSILGIVVYAIVARWVFKINDQLNNQDIIIQLLGQLLLRQGLTEEEVRKIMNSPSKIDRKFVEEEKKKNRFW